MTLPNSDSQNLAVLKMYLNRYENSVIGVYLRTGDVDALTTKITEAKEALAGVTSADKQTLAFKDCPPPSVPCPNQPNECCIPIDGGKKAAEAEN